MIRNAPSATYTVISTSILSQSQPNVQTFFMKQCMFEMVALILLLKATLTPQQRERREKKERYLLVIYCVCSTDLEFVGFYFGLLARKENIIITTCEHSWLLANGDRLLLKVTQTQPPETFQSQNIHYILHIYGPDSSEG